MAESQGDGKGAGATAMPLWFGAADRPLQGWLHTPAGERARGAVVLCPPIGIELSHSQNAYRLLARALAADGFLALRFDYDGTGQSAGVMGDPGRMDAWLESIHLAIELVRGLGARWVGAVGLRLGATLLTHAAAAGLALDSVCLWDPCVTGKAFLREQRALYSAVRLSEESPEMSFEIPGYSLTDQTVEEIRGLEIPVAVSSPCRGFVLLDPQRTTIRQELRRRLAIPNLDWAEHVDDTTPFDLSRVAWRQPNALVAQVAEWFDSACASEPEAVPRPPSPSPAIVALSEEGAIVENFARLGPFGLFGISCELDKSRGSGNGPTILFLSMGADSSIGPARQWVELARYWATLGFRSIRFDLSGIGESPTRTGCLERQVYASHSLDDICEVAAAASPDDARNVVLIGVCSGAYAALAVAPRLCPRGVAAINPHLTLDAYRGSLGTESSTEPGSSRRNRIPMVSPRTLVRTAGSRFRNSVPRWLWRFAYRLRLAHSPAQLLLPAMRARIPILLMLGRDEAHVPLRRTPQTLRRLDASYGSAFEMVPDLQHSLLHAMSRATVRGSVTEFLNSVASAGAVGGTGTLNASRELPRSQLPSGESWRDQAPRAGAEFAVSGSLNGARTDADTGERIQSSASSAARALHPPD